MGVGLLYFIPDVQTNRIISTLLIGVSRIFSGMWYFRLIFSKRKLFDSMHGNISIYLIDTIYFYWFNIRIGFIWSYYSTIFSSHCSVHVNIPNGIHCSFCKSCNMATIFTYLNIQKKRYRRKKWRLFLNGLN